MRHECRTRLSECLMAYKFHPNGSSCSKHCLPDIDESVFAEVAMKPQQQCANEMEATLNSEQRAACCQ